MNQYSEIVGSFLRNGPFSLEADYVFESEEALLQFYSEPENNAIVHQGWFKIVGEGDNQSLYWVVKEGEDLKFVKLLEQIDRDSIYTDLGELSKKLNTEIKARQDADEEIWGDKEGVISDLHNIEELSVAVDQLRTYIEEMTSAISTIIKGDNSLELDEFEDYLKTLDYPSIQSLSEAISKFFNTVDDSDSKINTLPELQDFLEGYKDTDKLVDILTELHDSITGDVEKGVTIASLRRKLLDLIEGLHNRCNNLQTELDQTQVGVGLSGDGAYNSDKETYYLKDATSVMNALKTLDRLIHEGSAGVSTEAGNQLELKADGLYYNADIEYSEGILTFKVNGKAVQTYPLGVSSILKQGWYDSETESIILIFEGEDERIVIPVGSLIREWVVDNSSDKVVELTKEEVISNGPDKLSADVRLSSKSNNILKKDGNTLIVDGTPIKDLESKTSRLDDSIQNEVTRATSSESQIIERLNSLEQFQDLLIWYEEI